MINISAYVNPIPMAQRKPREQLEIAARSVLENFMADWPKIEASLEGCSISVTNPDEQTVRWTIKGLPTEVAELYNDCYARGFCNALIGVLNVPKVDLIFEVRGAGHE